MTRSMVGATAPTTPSGIRSSQGAMCARARPLRRRSRC